MPRLTRSLTPSGPIHVPNVLQFGAGNFIRAYFDWMLTLLDERTDFEGSVIVVKPTRGGKYETLEQQDGLFTTVARGIHEGAYAEERRISQCIVGVVQPYQQWDLFLLHAERPRIDFIVSNTTEAGIRFRPEPYQKDVCPNEFPAKLTRWLYHRWYYFKGEAQFGCHILPLELIENNGKELRRCIMAYAEHWDLPHDFRGWVVAHCVFYDTLVDRIVSGYPDDAPRLQQELEYRDSLLVACEYYHSFVIRNGPVPGLPLEEAGINVTYTDDLTPYRERKVRLLNGAHTAIVPTGYLAGLETVGEVMDDERMLAYLRQVLYDEIVPSLDQPAEELRAFADDVLDRFRNPSIQHKLLDISLNSTSKFRTRLLPSLLNYREKFGKLPPGIVRALAALFVFYRGRRGDEDIPLRDAEDRLAFFREQWTCEQSTEDLASNVLARKDWWGQDLREVDGLVAGVAREVEVLVAAE